MRRGHALQRRGFTLVEILIGFAILAMLVVAIAAVVNPAGVIAKAKDARRKNDLKKIRDAFEEYFNDKGCYPDQTKIDELESLANCRSNVFQPWLNTWPCDPSGQPYILAISTISSNCSNWFKILTNLENRNDTNIPDGWYEFGDAYHIGDGTYGVNDANYGTSSTNVNWYDSVLHPSCEWHAENHIDDWCYVKPAGGGCNGAPDNSCSGSNCYALNNCHESDICKVSCCGVACN